MAHEHETIKPHEWTPIEAFNSGKTAFRIGVKPIDNPFKDMLGRMWQEGYNDAQANVPYSPRRNDYVEEDRGERNNRPRGKSGMGRQQRTEFKKPIFIN